MLRSIFNIILIVLIFLSTIGYVGNELTKADFLIAQAKNVHLYEQATTQVGSLISKDNLNNLPLSQDEIKTVITKSIDAQTFYSRLNEFASAYLDWLTGRSNTLNYELKLSPIKNKLTSQLTAQLISNYQALPTCQTSQLKDWDATNSFPSCQLSSTNIQSKDVNSLLGNQADELVSPLPDSWKAPAPSENLNNARTHISQVIDSIKIIWLTTLGFVLLYIIVARRKAFLSLALIFLVAGLLEIGFSFVAWDWLKHLIVDLISTPDQSQQLVTLISTLVDDIVQALKTILGNLSIITLSTGGFFLILWAFTSFRRSKDKMEIPRR